MCEAGSIHLQLSAVLGHPDQPHFPHPPPPTSTSKRKTPSNIRRQDLPWQDSASRAEEIIPGVVDATKQKHSE